MRKLKHRRQRREDQAGKITKYKCCQGHRVLTGVAQGATRPVCSTALPKLGSRKWTRRHWFPILLRSSWLMIGHFENWRECPCQKRVTQNWIECTAPIDVAIRRIYRSAAPLRRICYRVGARPKRVANRIISIKSARLRSFMRVIRFRVHIARCTR